MKKQNLLELAINQKVMQDLYNYLLSLTNEDLKNTAVLSRKFLASVSSANKKTGNICQTYTDIFSCPSCCKCKDICYAKALFYMHKHWLTANLNIIELAKKILANVAPGELIRHNVAGDISNGKKLIDKKLLQALDIIYQNYHAYTYTHCSKCNANLKAIKSCKNLVVNCSCDDLEDVKKVTSAGVPAVLAVNSMTAPVVKKDGVLYCQCLQQVDPGKYTCKNCQMCANKNRTSVICFVAHGSKKKDAAGVLVDL